MTTLAISKHCGYVLEDPFGHRWSVATHVRDVTSEEMQKAMKGMCPEEATA